MARIGFRSTTAADGSAIKALLQQAHGAAQAQPAEARGAGNTLMRHVGTLADAIVTSDGGEAALRLLPWSVMQDSLLFNIRFEIDELLALEDVRAIIRVVRAKLGAAR